MILGFAFSQCRSNSLPLMHGDQIPHSPEDYDYQIPSPREGKGVKCPSPREGKGVKCPGYVILCPGDVQASI